MSPGGVSWPAAGWSLVSVPHPLLHYCPLSHFLLPNTASPQNTMTTTHCNVGTRPCTAVISGTPTTAPAALLPLPLGASLVLLGPAVGIDKPDMLGGQGVIMGCAGGMQVAPIQVG